MQFLESLDQGTVSFFQFHQNRWLDALFLHATRLGDSWFVALVTVVALWLFVEYRQLRAALLLAATALSAAGLNLVIKTFVARERPAGNHPLEALPSSFSFPSGHALVATAVYLALALLVAARLGRPGLADRLKAAAFLLAFLVGVSRIYLGVHYVTDVFGGWAAGLALALTCNLLDALWGRPAPAPVPARVSYLPTADTEVLPPTRRADETDLHIRPS